MAEETNGADVDVSIAGQQVKLKNVKSLNTILTLVAAGAALFVVYLVIEHKADAKTQSDSQISVMKDMAQSIREGNCLNAHPEAVRETKVEQCKRLAR